jgi:hypothetical protein
MRYGGNYKPCDNCAHNQVCALKANMALYLQRLDELLPDLTKGDVAKNDPDLLDKFEPFFIGTEVICQYKTQIGDSLKMEESK